MTISIGKRVKVIHEHSGPEHRHHMFYPGSWRDNEAVIYRDAIGRVGNSDGYAWLPMICAILEECPASVLVRRDLLEDLAQSAMEAVIVP